MAWLAGRLRRARAAGEALADEETAELTANYWRTYDARMASVGFRDVAQRFPGLVGQAVRLGWSASRLDTASTLGLNLVSGAFAGYALFATVGVLQALFAAGPTPHRVRAALPSLILVALATAARSGISAAAGWAQSRLEPQVDQAVEVRLFDLTSRVELAAFDDPDFYDRLERAKQRGLYSSSQLVNNVINFVTAFAGIAAAATVVGVLQPVLLAVLLLAQVPGAWAAVRSARIRYVTRFALIDSYRRKYILTDLIGQRRTAAELRSFTMRSFLIGRVSRLAAYARNAELTAARRQTVTRVLGSVMGGVATAGSTRRSAACSPRARCRCRSRAPRCWRSVPPRRRCSSSCTRSTSVMRRDVRRRVVAGADRGDRPGPRQLAADRAAQHHDGAVAR